MALRASSLRYQGIGAWTLSYPSRDITHISFDDCGGPAQAAPVADAVARCDGLVRNALAAWLEVDRVGSTGGPAVPAPSGDLPASATAFPAPRAGLPTPPDAFPPPHARLP